MLPQTVFLGVFAAGPAVFLGAVFVVVAFAMRLPPRPARRWRRVLWPFRDPSTHTTPGDTS